MTNSNDYSNWQGEHYQNLWERWCDQTFNGRFKSFEQMQTLLKSFPEFEQTFETWCLEAYDDRI